MSTTRAKSLRRSSTDAERLLWSALRNQRLNGLKFKRQQPIGRYIVDFICFERGLVVEVDGGQHGPQIDAARTAYLEAAGFRVLRFWNPEVLTRLDDVVATILAAAEDPSFSRDG
ncbi:endonuclease domain-containing protein [Azospirillum sp.]|uniref:endonuclease domain-containing protein n=1 Tax=Azospirillum sp. TaxID=34012 RepID=UPI003D71F1FE